MHMAGHFSTGTGHRTTAVRNETDGSCSDAHQSDSDDEHDLMGVGVGGEGGGVGTGGRIGRGGGGEGGSKESTSSLVRSPPPYPEASSRFLKFVVKSTSSRDDDSSLASKGLVQRDIALERSANMLAKKRRNQVETKTDHDDTSSGTDERMDEEKTEKERNETAIRVSRTEFRAELLNTIPVRFPCSAGRRNSAGRWKKTNAQGAVRAMADGRKEWWRKNTSSSSSSSSSCCCPARSESRMDRVWASWKGPLPRSFLEKLRKGSHKCRNRACDAMASDRYVYFFPWAERDRSEDWCEEESIRRRTLENGRNQFLRKCRVMVREATSRAFYSATLFALPAGRLPSATPSIPLGFAIGDRMITIVTTACLPWLTGTSINPLLRAAYLESHHRARVTLLVPYLELDDQRQVYPDQLTFDRPLEQEAYVRHWVQERLNLTPRFRIVFYPAVFDPHKNSIFPVAGFDVTELISDAEADVAVLEEPEHLCWYHFGQRWRNKFRLVVGIAHTNYVEYVRREPAGAWLAFLLWFVNVQVARANCDRVIRLSAGVQHFARSIVSNVHGVAPQFLKHSGRQGFTDPATAMASKAEKSFATWKRAARYRTPIGSTESIMSESTSGDDINDRGLAVPWARKQVMGPGATMQFSKGCYFIGKMIWGKGYRELCDLLVHHCKKFPVQTKPSSTSPVRQSLGDEGLFLRGSNVSLLRHSLEEGSFRGSRSLRHFVDDGSLRGGHLSLRQSIEEGWLRNCRSLRQSTEDSSSLRASLSSLGRGVLCEPDFDLREIDDFEILEKTDREKEIEAQRNHLIESFLRRSESPHFGKTTGSSDVNKKPQKDEDGAKEERGTEAEEDGEKIPAIGRVKWLAKRIFANRPGGSGGAGGGGVGVPSVTSSGSGSSGPGKNRQRGLEKEWEEARVLPSPNVDTPKEVQPSTTGTHGSESASTEDDEPEVWVDVYGSGSEERQIEEFSVKHNLPMIFHGRRDHADPSIREYKVFLNPSVSDVLCTTTAEALAMGKFALIADHPSNEFFATNFPENCLVYNPKDPDNFSRMVIFALKNQPAPLSAEQRQLLTWEAATERFLEAAGL